MNGTNAITQALKHWTEQAAIVRRQHQEEVARLKAVNESLWRLLVRPCVDEGGGFFFHLTGRWFETESDAREAVIRYAKESQQEGG